MEQQKVCRRNIGVIANAKRQRTGSIAVKRFTGQVYIQMAQSVRMKRLGQPEEVAKAVALLPIDTTFTTGAEIAVDGGWSQL